MKHLLRGLLLIILLLPMGVFAQSEDDITIDDIENAFANVFKNDSVRMEGVAQIDQTITVSGMNIVQSITQDIAGEMTFAEGVLTGLTSAITQTVSSDTAGTITEGGMLMELIYVDEIVYMRVSETEGVLAGTFPEGWINLNTDADSVEGLALINMDTLLSTFDQPLVYPLNEETVINFEMVDVDPELEFAEGTVAYLVEINAEAAFAAGGFAEMFSGFEALGIDMEDLLNQMMEGAELSAVVYLLDGQLVGIASAMVLDADITIQGQTMTLVQNMTSFQKYTDFNFELEITAPEE